jgi:hypothetical protein
MSNQSFLGRAVGLDRPIAPGLKTEKFPAGDGGFSIGPAAQPASTAAAEAKPATRMGSLVAAMPAEAKGPSSLGDAYEQYAQNPSNIGRFKVIADAMFAEGSA